MTTFRPQLADAIALFVTSYPDVTHPDVTVDLGCLLAPEGNAFAVLGRVTAALTEAGIDPGAYNEAATAGDYELLLDVTRRTLRCIERGPFRTQDLETWGVESAAELIGSS